MSASEIDAILSDFRGWLENLPPAAPVAASTEPVDLATVVGQFTALRHEVNLQTRTARAQQELLTQALDRLEPADSEETPEFDVLRPLVQSLVDTVDAQILAAREMRRVADVTRATIERWRESSPPARPRSWLARLFFVDRASLASGAVEQVLNRRLGLTPTPEVEQWCGIVESAAAGLEMGLQRVERILQRHGLMAIPAIGERFDPETMEVVEVAAGTEHPSGHVVAEIRRGYLWNERVFRYAQVRVAR